MKLKELVKQFIPMNYWNTRRKASIIRQQGKVADFWAPILKAYYNGEIERYSLKPKKSWVLKKRFGNTGDRALIKMSYPKSYKYVLIRLTGTKMIIK